MDQIRRVVHTYRVLVTVILGFFLFGTVLSLTIQINPFSATAVPVECLQPLPVCQQHKWWFLLLAGVVLLPAVLQYGCLTLHQPAVYARIRPVYRFRGYDPMLRKYSRGIEQPRLFE